MEMSECPKCGSREIDRGRITSSSWQPRYISDKQKALKIPPKVISCVCLHCGYVELYTDAEKVRENRK